MHDSLWKSNLTKHKWRKSKNTQKACTLQNKITMLNKQKRNLNNRKKINKTYTHPSGLKK